MSLSQPWLKDKNIVIIGGTTGIGWSAAKAFVNEGASVVAVGLEADNKIDLSPAERATLLVLEGDARDEETTLRAIEACEKNFGSCTGFYHVAGGSGRKFGDGPLDEMTTEGWELTLQLNLTTLMYTNRSAVRYFHSRNAGGSILNTGSVLGFSPAPSLFATHAYAAAKSALLGFSRSLAAYYAKDNIRVNVIAPGLVHTPMARRASEDPSIMTYIQSKQPLDGGRIGRPEDLDGLAIYFMSDYSRFVTGQVVAVDGGWSVSEGRLSSAHPER